MTNADALKAFQQFETQLRPLVARNVPPADVDDVLQDVFLRLQRAVSSVREEERLGGWVHQVARSAIAERHRARARHPLATDDALPELPRSESDGDEELRQALVSCLARFVTLLPSPYREAVTLTEIEGVPQREAAQMLGVSLSGMKSRVQRGRARLRSLFEDCCRIAVDARGRVTSCAPKGSTSDDP